MQEEAGFYRLSRVQLGGNGEAFPDGEPIA